MNATQRCLRDQVLVITGAESGIGFATAEIAAERGAAVVLAAQSQLDLTGAVARIAQNGGCVAAVAADPGNERHIVQVGLAAIREFGRIDTWVNCASIDRDGALLDQPTREARRLFDLNFWSVVYGCRVAVEHMKSHGGTIVNVGREVSDRAAPLVGIYHVSKEAVRGYTDALRAELRHAESPVRVSFVKHVPVESAPHPYAPPNDRTARRRVGQPPDVVARAILRCAERPVREVRIGGTPRLHFSLSTIAPPVVALGAVVAAGALRHAAEESNRRDRRNSIPEENAAMAGSSAAASSRFRLLRPRLRRVPLSPPR